MSKTQPTLLVIIGITGDLSTRKLLPAIEAIAASGAAPQQLRVVGVTRQELQVTDVLDRLPNGASRDFLRQHLTLYQMDVTSPEAYRHLAAHLTAVEQTMEGEAQRLFYVSVPPQVSQPIVRHLGESGLAASPAKLLLEKPFGVDLASARELIEHTKQYFDESQIYRIDHYVAKEMAQNLIVFRESNALFKRTWNKDFIASIDVIADEHIGIEGRATFYEQTGALRDIVQSHLLLLAALTLMETPEVGHLDDVPERRLQALRYLHIPTERPIADYVVRGQYEGYKQEVQNPHSTVETYVEVLLESRDPKWQGVPIRLCTGKALAAKRTEIRITYKKDYAEQGDQLVIMLQPSEGVALHLLTKVPGYAWHVENHALQLAFKDHFSHLPEPYEQVFLDAINGNHTLFTSSEEVLETWRILAPIQEYWQLSDDTPILYLSGSKGPKKHIQ